MNQDTVNKMLRAAAAWAIGFALGKGWIVAADAGALTDAVVLIGGCAVHAGIIAYTNRKSAKVAAVQAMPDMQVATSNAEIAAAVPEATLSKPGEALTVVPSPKPPT